MRPDDEGFWPAEPDVPVPTYCTPEDVAMTLDLPDPDDSFGYYRFTEMSHPSYAQVCKMIVSNEDKIDMRTRRTWRVNQVKDYVTDIPQYFWDEVSFRTGYYANGGNYVQLRKNILPWDPQKGDRLEFRNVLNSWGDHSKMEGDPDRAYVEYLGPDNFWFDYAKGRLFLKTRRLQPKYNALRITYRYGSEEPVPEGIRRLCSLITAQQIINMQAFAVKVGLGGDIAGIKDQMLKMWQDEVNELYSMYQRSGSVHGVPQR